MRRGHRPAKPTLNLADPRKRTPTMFQGLLLTRTDDGALKAAVTELDDAQLPPGDVVVQISHSTLNYKDGLAITGKAPVVRSFPMVPGIDFAGVVQSSSDQVLASFSMSARLSAQACCRAV